MESDETNQGIDGYKLIATAIENAVSELLFPFKMAAKDVSANPKEFNEYVFFDNFLRYSSSFTENLCTMLAKEIRTITIVKEIRGTPSTTLAKRIRQESFDKLDSVLNQYVQVMSLLGIAYSKSSVVGSAVTGAVVGKVLGGPEQERGDTYAILGGLLGAVGELGNQKAIESHARLAAYVAIQRYLNVLESLPETLLDSGVALIDGGAVDFNRQSKTLDLIHESIVNRLRKCSEIIRLIPELKEKKEKETSRQDTWSFALGFFVFLIILIGYGLISHGKENVHTSIDISLLIIFMIILVFSVIGLILSIKNLKRSNPEIDEKQNQLERLIN